ncbi:unnamed protein product, partial [Vitis vinifera]
MQRDQQFCPEKSFRQVQRTWDHSMVLSFNPLMFAQRILLSLTRLIIEARSCFIQQLLRNSTKLTLTREKHPLP